MRARERRPARNATEERIRRTIEDTAEPRRTGPHEPIEIATARSFSHSAGSIATARRQCASDSPARPSSAASAASELWARATFALSDNADSKAGARLGAAACHQLDGSLRDQEHRIRRILVLRFLERSLRLRKAPRACLGERERRRAPARRRRRQRRRGEGRRQPRAIYPPRSGTRPGATPLRCRQDRSSARDAKRRWPAGRFPASRSRWASWSRPRRMFGCATVNARGRVSASRALPSMYNRTICCSSSSTPICRFGIIGFGVSRSSVRRLAVT